MGKTKEVITQAAGRTVVRASNSTALLGSVLVILKALNLITLAWWLVLLPFYWGLALLAGFLLLAGILFGITYVVLFPIDRYQRWKNRRNVQRIRQRRRQESDPTPWGLPPRIHRDALRPEATNKRG